MERLDLTFAALADHTRRAILTRLAAGEQTVMDLARPFQMTQPAVSKHLRVLESAGLITRRAEGARRPCRLSRHGFDSVQRWMDLLRPALEKNYDRLDHVLAEMTHHEGEENR